MIKKKHTTTKRKRKRERKERRRERKKGGYVVKPIKVSDDFARFTKDGKLLPGKEHKRQAWIKGLRRFFLWTIAVVGIVVFILRKLGW